MSRRGFLRWVPAAAAVGTALAIAVFADAEPTGPALTFTVDGSERSGAIEPAVIRRRLISPEFNPPLAVRAGLIVIARGSLACDPGEIFRVDVTVEQDDTVGHGRTVGRCTGEVQEWRAVVVARHGRFASGPSSACAVATTRRTGITDRFEWCGTPVLAAA